MGHGLYKAPLASSSVKADEALHQGQCKTLRSLTQDICGSISFNFIAGFIINFPGLLGQSEPVAHAHCV